VHWLRRVRLALVLLAVAAAGVATAFAATVPGSSSATAAVARTVVVRGTDTSVSISPKTFAKGTVTFKIANKGSKTHVFVVAGKRTPVKPHHTATVKIVFRAAGKVKWTWTGTKTISGVLTVTGGGTTTSTGTSTTTTVVSTTTTASTATTTTTTTTTTTIPTACSNPTTTVMVGMFEYRFELSANSVPAGCIQFVITNKGAEGHNFDLAGVKVGALLASGGTETWSVQLAAKNYSYLCDVPFHSDRGMVGDLTVTP